VRINGRNRVENGRVRYFAVFIMDSMDPIDRLVDFAREFHGGFKQISSEQARFFFQAFAATTIVYQERGEILGFAVYTEREDRIIFICIAVKKEQKNNWRAVPIFMSAIEKLPDKPIYYVSKDIKLRLLYASRDRSGDGRGGWHRDRAGTSKEVGK